METSSLKSPALAGGFFTTRGTWETPINLNYYKDVRRGAQGDSLQASGKSGLHAHGDGERVFALESW